MQRKLRLKSRAFLAVLVAPAAVFFAAAGDIHASAIRVESQKDPGDVGKCCVELVAAAQRPGTPIDNDIAQREFAAASRLRVNSRFLPVGLASERGLQVRTILVSRSISAEFPQIHEIGGVRPDPLPWHPRGLALDVMIPNPGSVDGIELGNQIVAYVLNNASRFGIQDAIWRGIYYTPGGKQSGHYGHFDHVHVTTTGGGYPTGGEVYLR